MKRWTGHSYPSQKAAMWQGNLRSEGSNTLLYQSSDKKFAIKEARPGKEKVLTHEKESMMALLQEPWAVEVFAGLEGYGDNFLVMPWFDTDAETWIQGIDALRPLAERLALASAFCGLVERFLRLKPEQRHALPWRIHPTQLLVHGQSPHLLTRIGDLGNMRAMGSGTDGYIALDQSLLQNSIYYKHWDVYACGATVFYLLTGQTPQAPRQNEEARSPSGRALSHLLDNALSGRHVSEADQEKIKVLQHLPYTELVDLNACKALTESDIELLREYVHLPKIAELIEKIQSLLTPDPSQRLSTVHDLHLFLHNIITENVVTPPPPPHKKITPTLRSETLHDAPMLSAPEKQGVSAGFIVGVIMITGIAGFGIWNLLHKEPIKHILSIGVTKRDKVLSVTGHQIVLKYIPSGSYWMGCFEDESNCGDNEKPAQKIKIDSGFYMMQTEVTQGLFQDVMSSNPSDYKDCGKECPVEMVSLEDAISFANKLSGLTGETWRVPTEEQWEWAARGGEDFIYAGSNDPHAVGWLGEEWSKGSPHPVRQKKPNAFGLYDMTGNVWEWTTSMYRPYPGSTWTQKAEDKGQYRVDRGGSWGSDMAMVRNSFRDWGAAGYRFNGLGFRLIQ